MTLALTPARLAATYDFLRAFPPFNRWRLPPAREVRFEVIATKGFYGQHRKRRGRPHKIQVSAGLVGHAYTLLWIMSHEMVHLHQIRAGLIESHGDEFIRLDNLICRRFGFDPKAF